jgi:hypothetical protein
MFRKQPKPRSFDYRPRYFDPDKEQSSLRPLKGDDTEVRKQRISRRFRDYSGGGSTHPGVQRQIRQSNLRLVLILAVMLLLGYWFVSGNLEGIIAALQQ